MKQMSLTGTVYLIQYSVLFNHRSTSVHAASRAHGNVALLAGVFSIMRYSIACGLSLYLESPYRSDLRRNVTNI